MSPEMIALVTTTTPLLAAFVALVFFRNDFPKARAIVIGAGIISLLGAVWLIALGPQAEPIRHVWLQSGATTLRFGFLLDGLSLIMGLIVAFIALCVEVYSIGYMAHDDGQGRFFSFLALFSWAMLSFVYASNAMQAFVFWELVGLCSFLLIGFWYRKPSAVAAGKKAFVMTRIGDVGLLVGLILLLSSTGTFDIVTINADPSRIPAERLDLICLLIFAGVVGKSAQFPLHTWLPDAMEGPTPVSALLHSATMVAAGVFLFARFHPLFLASPTTLTVVLAISTFTAVFAATMAMVARDIKKVLAYSSISQLGYMLMALAAGGFFAGVFHLTTHAAFKALLFLCAGALIHYTGSNDLVTIGRATRGKLKTTKLGLLAGGLSLAGVPPMAGFFSKETIIHQLGAEGLGIFLIGAYAGAFLTAYYTSRMVCLVWFPDDNSAAEAEAPDLEHAHREPVPAPMRLPIVVLAVFAVVLGGAAGLIADLLGTEVEWPHLPAALPAILTVLAGLALGWIEFGKKGASQVGFIHRFPAIHRLFSNRWYIDATYRNIFAAGSVRLAKGAYKAETEAFDAFGDTIGKETIEVGDGMAHTQTGRLQAYLITTFVVLAAGALYIGLGLGQ